MIKYLLIVVVFLSSCALSATAGDRTWMVDSFFDIWYEVPGTPGGPVMVNATGTAVTREAEPPGADGSFDTEMLSLSLTGVSPFGPVMIRESPTRQSTGRVSFPIPGDPDFDLFSVHSFFDVFTEISTDGGQTWAYNAVPAHYYGASDSFFDITYRLDADAQLADGHVTVLKSGSTLDMTPTVPEPSSVAALLTGVAGLAGFGIRRRKTS